MLRGCATTKNHGNKTISFGLSELTEHLTSTRVGAGCGRRIRRFGVLAQSGKVLARILHFLGQAYARQRSAMGGWVGRTVRPGNVIYVGYDGGRSPVVVADTRL